MVIMRHREDCLLPKQLGVSVESALIYHYVKGKPMVELLTELIYICLINTC